MNRVPVKDFHQSIVQRLCNVTAANSTIATDQVAQIRAFIINFKRFAQTPHFLHMVLQLEFRFEYILDTYGMKDAHAGEMDALMVPQWPDSIFIIVDHTNIEVWITRISHKWKEIKNQTACWVILVPSRTSSYWFQDEVLENAKEIRFLRGSTTIPSTRPDATRMDPNDFSDAYCLCVYDKRTVLPDRKRERHQAVSVISLGARFSDTDLNLEIKPLQSEKDVP
jgi:hypothetical protein